MEIKKQTFKNKTLYLVFDDCYPIDIANEFLLYLFKLNRSTNTLKHNAYCIKVFFEFLKFKNLDIQDITKIQKVDYFLVELISYLKIEERSNNTVNLMISCIINFLNVLKRNKILYNDFPLKPIKEYRGFISEFVNHGNIKENNCYSSLRLKSDSKEFRLPTFNIYEELLKIIFDDTIPTEYIYPEMLSINCSKKLLIKYRNALIVELMDKRGLRIGELLGIHLEDISNISENIIQIVRRENNQNNALAKTGNREVKIDPLTAARITQYAIVISCRYNTDYLFINIDKNEGTPLKSITVNKLFDNFSSKLKQKGFLKDDEKVHPHLLRHDFGTNVQRENNDSFLTMTMMGHKSINSTSIYVNYCQTDQTNALNKIQVIDDKIDYLKENEHGNNT